MIKELDQLKTDTLSRIESKFPTGFTVAYITRGELERLNETGEITINRQRPIQYNPQGQYDKEMLSLLIDGDDTIAPSFFVPSEICDIVFYALQEERSSEPLDRTLIEYLTSDQSDTSEYYGNYHPTILIFNGIPEAKPTQDKWVTLTKNGILTQLDIPQRAHAALIEDYEIDFQKRRNNHIQATQDQFPGEIAQNSPYIASGLCQSDSELFVTKKLFAQHLREQILTISNE